MRSDLISYYVGTANMRYRLAICVAEVICGTNIGEAIHDLNCIKTAKTVPTYLPLLRQAFPSTRKWSGTHLRFVSQKSFAIKAINDSSCIENSPHIPPAESVACSTYFRVERKVCRRSDTLSRKYMRIVLAVLNTTQVVYNFSDFFFFLPQLTSETQIASMYRSNVSDKDTLSGRYMGTLAVLNILYPK
ncbi:hypothetical protein AVEN_241554-1 [Araneus ventricosus]|uniref:Uncharacterized protein n=1 Tax=Araneus ventricosus TaxID=182803 RepID=A0A4Y2LP59_ARAVE|nr:hypothetical protein AVEN_78019-1 [Araneus ventricosus]GBN16269.1 hypothetical protein AVEN_80213-1 [Araneus ventricosus]GBN16605.1 hypothetical protein AVEN_217061-1 [Araneus ventricosus]GBN16606.1 hypothetical protein AVEN_241554-1 [Araneus ventricosus]